MRKRSPLQVDDTGSAPKTNHTQPPFHWSNVTFLASVVGVLAIGCAVYKSPAAMRSLMTPISASIIVALFAYLALDRLREMGSRIQSVDERSLTIWQELSKEARDVAEQQAKTTISSMQDTLQQNMKSVSDHIDKLVAGNPWLRDIGPDDIAPSDHIEPIFHAAKEMIGKGKKEHARKWIMAAVENPSIKGAPSDYHNLGILSARDLNDDLLALRIYDKYLEGTNEPDPDILGDVLETATRADDSEHAAKVTKLIRDGLDINSARFVLKWRPWVFLSDYLAYQGNFAEAISLLQKGITSVRDPQEKPHLICNLGRVQYKSGDPAAAEAVLKECVRDYPGHIPALSELANMYWFHGRNDELLSVLELAAERKNLGGAFESHFRRLSQMLETLRSAQGATDPKETFLSGVSLAIDTVDEVVGPEMKTRVVEAIKRKLSEQKAHEG